MTPSALFRRLPAAVLAASAAIGCDARETAERPLTIVVSGDTAGWITPCGCASNQSGGLLRRGDYVRQLRAMADVLYADVGGAAGGTSPYDREKFEAILRGESGMGVAAHNLGAAEARLGAAYLRQVGERLRVPFVSCNVRDAQGELVAPSLRVIEAAGRRVALIGALSDREKIDGVQIDPPRASILRALDEAKDDFDGVIVLAYLPDEELRDLAANLPEADVVIGGPTGQSLAPQRIGPTLALSATNKGKFLARLDAPAAPADPWSAEIVEMTGQWSDDPQQRENLQQFYQALAKHDFAPLETSFRESASLATPVSYRVAGSESCRDCHTEEHEIWLASKHAHAWDSLQTSGAHVDAFCQQCHTTGYGVSGGFQSPRRTPKLVGVGCESCHGPSQAHAQDPQTPTAYFGRARDRCTRCHDRENSPHFAYDEYWRQIRHGGDSQASTDSSQP